MSRKQIFRLVLFICTLAAIAIFIHISQSRRETQKIEAQKVVASAVAEKQKYLDYVNTGIVRNPGEKMVAVACASESGTMNAAIGDALANHFQQTHVQFASSFFRPTLITDGLFDAVFNGSKDTFQKLGIENALDGLLLARQQVQYSTNSGLNGLITATMHLQVVTLPVSGQVESQSWTLSSSGAGFNLADARMQAEERIVKQIADNPKMALSQVKTDQ